MLRGYITGMFSVLMIKISVESSDFYLSFRMKCAKIINM